MGFFNKLFGKNQQNKKPALRYYSVIKGESITMEEPLSEAITFQLNDIEKIETKLTTDGPAKPDVWMVITLEDSHRKIHIGAEGYDELYETVSKLPGFDFKAVIMAMSTVPDKEYVFTLWSKNPSEVNTNLEEESGPRA